MMQPETYEMIEQYLLGKMTLEGQQAFEQRLANEPGLAQETELQKQIFEALRQAPKAAAFREKLAAIEKKTDLGTTVPTRRLPPVRRWLALAAGLMVLALAGWYFFNKKTAPPPAGPQAVFDAHFKMPEQIAETQHFKRAKTDTSRDIAATRTDTTTASPTEENETWNALWTAFLDQYDQKEFAAALASLEQIQAMDTPGDFASETFFYKGLLHLRLGEAALSLQDFEKVDTGHTEERDWYSALALLSLGRTDEAVVLFQKIGGSAQPRSQEATAILKDL